MRTMITIWSYILVRKVMLRQDPKEILTRICRKRQDGTWIVRNDGNYRTDAGRRMFLS